jgi:hypothetical protein
MNIMIWVSKNEAKHWVKYQRYQEAAEIMQNLTLLDVNYCLSDRAWSWNVNRAANLGWAYLLQKPGALGAQHCYWSFAFNPILFTNDLLGNKKSGNLESDPNDENLMKCGSEMFELLLVGWTDGFAQRSGVCQQLLIYRKAVLSPGAIHQERTDVTIFFSNLSRTKAWSNSRTRS